MLELKVNVTVLKDTLPISNSIANTNAEGKKSCFMVHM